MALYWSGARVKVRRERELTEEDQGYPEDTMVIVMKPGQENDPSFARAVRHVVTLRTLEHEREGRAALHGHGTKGNGDEPVRPSEKNRSCEEREEIEAERRFMETFLDDGGLGFGEPCGCGPYGFGGSCGHGGLGGPCRPGEFGGKDSCEEDWTPFDDELSNFFHDLLDHNACIFPGGDPCSGGHERGMVQLVIEHFDRLVVAT